MRKTQKSFVFFINQAWRLEKQLSRLPLLVLQDTIKNTLSAYSTHTVTRQKFSSSELFSLHKNKPDQQDGSTGIRAESVRQGAPDLRCRDRFVAVTGPGSWQIPLRAGPTRPSVTRAFLSKCGHFSVGSSAYSGPGTLG